MSIHFFLGTNGPYGFFSYLDDLIDYREARQVNIIKGTPGSGKSTFMAGIGRAMEERRPEYFHCSSDPDSLDGVQFDGVAFVDGTAPHVMEPKYPGVVDLYINISQFADQKGLSAERLKLETLLAANKMGFTLATPWINAASLLDDVAYRRVITPELADKIKSRGKSLCQREIPKSNRAALTPTKRFLSAVTPKGLMCLFDTVTDNYDRVIALDDNYGLAALMLPELAEYSASQGYKTYACYSPLHPENKIEHVLIPELKLAFVTNSHRLPYPAEATRHIRLDACIPPEKVKSQRANLRFIAKTSASCIDEAAGHLRAAKLVHDEIEDIYKKYMDFDYVNGLAERKISELRASC